VLLPDSPANGTALTIDASQALVYLEYSAGAGRWHLVHGWGANEVLLMGPEGGWCFVAITYSTTELRAYYRRDDVVNLTECATVSWTYDDSLTAILLTGWAGCAVQYWGCHVGVLTPAQLLAQSHSRTQLVAGRSYWRLDEASGADPVGNHTATLVSATAHTEAAPAEAITVDAALSALLYKDSFSRNYAEISTAPFPSAVTVCGWFKFGNVTHNSYVFEFRINDDNRLIFVLQHDADTTGMFTNLMSYLDGDLVEPCGGHHEPTVTLEQTAGWWFAAWTIVPGETTTTARVWLAPRGTTLTEVDAATPTWSHVHSGSYATRLVVSNGGPEFEAAHLRLYEGALTEGQLSALMASSAAQPTAWADYSLASGLLTDRSGHARHLTTPGEIWPGEIGPI
jgi:hypothetical protein